MAKYVLKPTTEKNKAGCFCMKNLMVQRLACSIFTTLMLTFSVQGIADVLSPEAIVPQTPKPPRLEPSHEDDSVPVAARFDIAISEIMYATSTNKLPQWIELHNRSTRRVNLEGWEVTIRNHPEDTTVLATKLTFTLGAQILNPDQVLLLVTEQGDNSGVGEANGDLRADSVVILKDLIGSTSGYRLLSETAFKVTLTAPAARKIGPKVPSDTAGNLGAIPAWELPLIEGERSSISRTYDGDDTSDGTTTDGWEFAVEQSTQYMQGTTYYGHHSDHGTPGYQEEAPLPVELSGFRAARGKPSGFLPVREQSTGVITITWTTQSEVNNAGFNIKRSKTKNGPFKIINATMIPGAGTTNEKQSYTFTDTTAISNVVYYYQLVCVSVDGTRRTLTRPTRLKGLIGYSDHFHRFEEAPFWWKDLNW